MLVTRLHARLVTLGTLLTLAIGWWAQQVPYFPIEISRTLATTPYAAYLFGAIFTLSLAAMVRRHLQEKRWPRPGAWVLAAGAGLIVGFDDARYQLLHTVGVYLMLAGIVLYVYQDAWGRRYWLLVAITIYGLRLALKAGVVLLFEMPALWLFGMYGLVGVAPWDELLVHFIGPIVARGLELMHTGAWNDPLWTPLVFKLGGVLQWIVLWMLLDILTD